MRTIHDFVQTVASTIRGHPLSPGRTTLRTCPSRFLDSGSGPRAITCQSHFRMTTRQTEAGEQSLQQCGNSAGAGIATDETRCLSIQCVPCIIIHNCGCLGGYVQSTVYHLVSRNEIQDITRPPSLLQVRHFLSRTQSVQQVRGCRSP